MSIEGSGSPRDGDETGVNEHRSPWKRVGGRDNAAMSSPISGSQSETAIATDPMDANSPPHAGTDATTSIFSNVEDDGELTKLHPNYKLLMRVSAIILALIFMGGATVLDNLLADRFEFPLGILTGVSVLIGLFLIIRVPAARFNARGYQISHDRLRVVRGIMWHSDTIVPFGRVQHIDVDQGPIERALDIATMTLHTAGSHNASVRLPGLGHELAVRMREEIRAHIKRESM